MEKQRVRLRKLTKEKRSYLYYRGGVTIHEHIYDRNTIKV